MTIGSQQIPHFAWGSSWELDEYLSGPFGQRTPASHASDAASSGNILNSSTSVMFLR